jgi:dCMP deaminase
MRHNAWINTSLRLARQSEFWPYKMGCIIVKSGKVVSRGVNKQSIAEAKDSRYNLGRSIHAELNAVLQAQRLGISLDGAILYVTGLSKADNTVCSKPCPICQEMLAETGIRAVYYQNKEGDIECLSFKSGT